ADRLGDVYQPRPSGAGSRPVPLRARALDHLRTGLRISRGHLAACPPRLLRQLPTLVPTQAPTLPSSILLVLTPVRPRRTGPGAKGEVAGREVLSVVVARGQDRILRFAARLRDRAAGAEPAPGRDAQRGRRVAGDGRAAAVHGALGHPGDRGEQAPGVGVAGRAEDLLGGRDLDDAAQVHDRDPVAQVPYHGQVVGYQQQREPEFVTQVRQQVEDGGLHADVERRYRLVRDQDVGTQREGPGD